MPPASTRELSGQRDAVILMAPLPSYPSPSLCNSGLICLRHRLIHFMRHIPPAKQSYAPMMETVCSNCVAESASWPYCTQVAAKPNPHRLTHASTLRCAIDLPKYCTSRPPPSGGIHTYPAIYGVFRRRPPTDYRALLGMCSAACDVLRRHATELVEVGCTSHSGILRKAVHHANQSPLKYPASWCLPQHGHRPGSTASQGIPPRLRTGISRNAGCFCRGSEVIREARATQSGCRGLPARGACRCRTHSSVVWNLSFIPNLARIRAMTRFSRCEFSRGRRFTDPQPRWIGAGVVNRRHRQMGAGTTRYRPIPSLERQVWADP